MAGNIVRALNWDLGFEQRFLAVNPLGDQISLYQTDNHEPAESSELCRVNSFTGVEGIQCMAYLKTHVGWAGVGTLDGIAHIFDITRKNITTLRLRPKQNRPCNSLSFNDGQLVAASFDRSRQDNSLQVWDLTKHSRVFVDDLDLDNSHPMRPQFGYLAGEATLSTMFNSEDASGMQLMAGGYKLLREFDLRNSSPAPIYQVATKSTMNLTLDPFQPHMFSSMSEDGSVSIWDRRKLQSGGKGAVASETPALHFPKLVSELQRRGLAPCFRYSTIRRGEFAAVLNGELIRRWNTGIVPKSADIDVPTFSAESGVVANQKQQSAKLYNPNEDLLFVALVLDSKTDFPRVISFDYAPDNLSHTSTRFVCMREKGLAFQMPVEESVESFDFNPFNEFSMAGPEGAVTHFLDASRPINMKDANHPPLDPKNEGLGIPSALYSEDVTSTIDEEEAPDPMSHSRADHLHFKQTSLRDPLGFSPHALQDPSFFLNKLLQNDICAVTRERAVLGYGVDSEKNLEVLEQTEEAGASLLLQNTWKWLGLAKKSLEKGTMVKEGVDLGYIGMLAMWKGVEELKGQNRATLNTQVSDELFDNAVKAIVYYKGKKSSGISVFNSTERKMQRKLCLIVCGWYLTAHEFDEKINVLVNGGQVEKAAGWAVFHGDVTRAIEILASAKDERLQLMSTAVAGYLAYKDSNVNLPWNDQCRKLSLELENPYLRAIFAFIADNDWWDVLDEHNLPLRERLGIAIRFLSDKDLNLYLNRVVEAVVSLGELEGLILTGITPRGINLLQSYVDRTSDVQTAALIAQFAVPRYFKDPRVDHWVHCYRELLDSWALFKQRAKFDIARVKSSKTSAGNVSIRPPPRQIFLQCKQCKKNMCSATTKNMKGTTSNPLMIKQFNDRLNLKEKSNLFTLCPHCGASFPRCSVCLLTLGAPIQQFSEPGHEREVHSAVHENFNSKFSFCLSCNHGYHAHHAEQWFSKHYVCPVPDCNCRCNSK